MFTEFDVIICIIILVFALVAFMRGATRDILSLFSWIGAGYATMYFYPLVFTKTQTFFTGAIAANMAAVVPTFIISLIVFSIISSVIIGGIKSSNIGMIDRSVGLLIGLVKGMFVASIIHLCIIFVTNEEPEWLKKGETYQLTQFGAKFINNSVNSSFADDETALEDIDTDSVRYKVMQMFDNKKFGSAIDDVKDHVDNLEDNIIDGDISDQIDDFEGLIYE